MGKLRQYLLIGAAGVFVLGAVEPAARSPRFYEDDPLAAWPDLASVETARQRGIDPLYDFLKQSARREPRPETPADAVNTLGEVPDSSWFTNRHGRSRMTLEELRRGPGNGNAPEAPFEVTGGKTEGITPGFKLRDARGRVYFVKPDPISNPEMATAADVIGSKFFFALGYNTPENYILSFRETELKLSRLAKVRASGRSRKMTWEDVKLVLRNVPRTPDGRLRMVASLGIDGTPLGPFRYEGTRSDDPNDVVPHERRRDLRGLHVMAAWLNHTDVKAGNTLDVLVEQAGKRVIRHYLIDFGAMLGSDSDVAKDARFGNEYMLPSGVEAVRGIFTFGLAGKAWEAAEYPDWKAVGRFEAASFDPEQWRPNYPNPAFLSRLPDDEYWGARQVMAFRDEEIRAIVETGEYSRPEVVDYITKTLIERRDKIGRVYFEKVLPLDHFRVEDGELRFEDLGVRHGFARPRGYEYQWSRFDNLRQVTEVLEGETSAKLPGGMEGAGYLMVRIHEAGSRGRTVRVFVRNRGGQAEVVGIERRWEGRN